MSCNPLRRPREIACCDCRTEVKVQPNGPVPMRCRPCAKAYNEQLSREWKQKHPYGRKTKRAEEEEERDLGPERPLLGMTEAELQAWRARRVVELYQREPELRLGDIGERLGMTAHQVGRHLNRAGLSIRKEGRGQLPAGLPV